jgi:hypothetical protein
MSPNTTLVNKASTEDLEMKFDPAIHTKEYLLKQRGVLENLASKSEKFAKSELAQDRELLLSVIFESERDTVAHVLAESQPAWVHTDAAKDYSILMAQGEDGYTVAHSLAFSQPDWLNSNAAKDPNILKCKCHNGWSVALVLATHQKGFIHTEAANNYEILSLTNKVGFSVAHRLVNNPDFMSKNVFFHKRILTIEYDNHLLAQYISDRYSESHGMNITKMAMLLIAQGAAYKHSKPMSADIGATLIEHSQQILEENSEPLISLKVLIALHSTIAHNIEKIRLSPYPKSFEEMRCQWENYQSETERMLRHHLSTYQNEIHQLHHVDYFCEPGDALVKKITSELIMNRTLDEHKASNTCTDEEETFLPSLY